MEVGARLRPRRCSRPCSPSRSALLAFLGYRTAVSASFFKVKTVDVDGATRASREEIRAAVLRLSNAGVWQADLEVIAKELSELPWVRDAVVTRVLPDGLRVRVTEREPRVIARNASGRLVWVDDDGVLLGAAIARRGRLLRPRPRRGPRPRRRGATTARAWRVGAGAEARDWEKAGL